MIKLDAPQKPGFGTGMYTYAEAAGLLKANTQSVRRWAEGYSYVRKGKAYQSEPVLQGDLDYQGVVSFYDLIELFLVKAYRDAGVALQEIRAAAQKLASEFETPYPFASKKLETDGRQLLVKAENSYQNVAKHQQVFDFVSDFFKNIDFEDGLARMWYPLGKGELVVVDPQRSFGAPIETRTGMRTEVLYSTYRAENNDIQAVAEWYEVPVDSVRAAVEFEERWKKAS